MTRCVALLGFYLATIVTANWMIRHVGTPIAGGTHLLPVGFGLMAPSGVYAAAMTLVARDLVQRVAGRWLGIAIIPVGAALTALFDVRLAVASGVAFLLSELLDFAVYTPLQTRGLALAVAASAVVGDVVDSGAFLLLAGIPLRIALPGLLLGKLWAIILATVLIAILSGRIAKASPA